MNKHINYKHSFFLVAWKLFTGLDIIYFVEKFNPFPECIVLVEIISYTWTEMVPAVNWINYLFRGHDTCKHEKFIQNFKFITSSPCSLEAIYFILFYFNDWVYFIEYEYNQFVNEIY